MCNFLHIAVAFPGVCRIEIACPIINVRSSMSESQTQVFDPLRGGAGAQMAAMRSPA